MKKAKKGLALVLSAVLLASTAVTVLLAASKSWIGAQLGDLSQYYETGNSADPGYISTVDGDSGGTSYGIYMFASNAGTPLAYIEWLRNTYAVGEVYRTIGDALYNAYAYNSAGQYYPGYGSNFNATWRSVAATYPAQFLQSQKDFWKDNYYATVLANLKASYPAFDVNDYSIALKNVLWSRSVQHGASGATTVVNNAFAALGGFKLQDEATLIHAIYTECSKLDTVTQSKSMTGTTAEKYGVSGKSMAYYSANSGAVQMSVYRRLHVNEPADALVMLYQNGHGTVANGVYRLQRNGESGQLLTVSDAAVCLASGTDFTVTHYANDYYTLATADGKRLSDSGGSVTMADAAAAYSQLWQIGSDSTLKNRGTGRYLTVADGKLITTDDAQKATAWPRLAQSTVLGSGLFYPGCEEGVTNKLVAGASSFPVRGIITSAVPLRSVTVSVTGPKSFTATAAPNAYFYDLWSLDSKCTFSSLTEGSYTLTITAASDGAAAQLGSSTFVVEKNTHSIVDDETYTVTFADGNTTTTRTYHLGDTYGELPTATSAGFTGWFLSDGTEIAANTIVAAGNHTVTAKYGELHTVKFVVGEQTVKNTKLANGEQIVAPANPIKAADSSYTYSFSCWKAADSSQYVAGYSYMGTADITYTAVFTKTAITSDGGGTSGGGGASSGGGGASGGATTPTASGNYLSGISPNTSVSSLNSSGYTVYSGSTKVTSGVVGTGMTATSGSTTVTIVVTGDTNGDGKYSLVDFARVRSHFLNSDLSGAYAKAADMNGDGIFNLTDIAVAIREALS